MPPKKKKASLAGVAKSAADPKAKKKAAKSVAAKLKKKAKAASSTKELTEEGAKVVTVAEGADATAPPPEEPVVPEPEPERVPTCVDIKILRRSNAGSSRRPPRHRRDACSMAWRCPSPLDRHPGRSTDFHTTPEPTGPPPLPDPSTDPLGYARAVWADDCPHEVAKSDIVLAYSHYKTAFPCRNGVVRWPAIDEEYAISFIFKGDFAKRIRAYPTGVTTANAEQAPLLVLAKGKKGVDDFGDADAALDEDYWLGLSGGISRASTHHEVDEDVAAGLGVETRDGPLVLRDERRRPAARPAEDGGPARASSATRARTSTSPGLEQPV